MEMGKMRRVKKGDDQSETLLDGRREEAIAMKKWMEEGYGRGLKRWTEEGT